VDGAAADPNVDADADADADAQDDEEHQSQDRLPPYPRGMLHLEVTDGVRVMKAIEYRRIPGLALGDTALGSKVCVFCHHVFSFDRLAIFSGTWPLWG
jgi:hypothetical protein